MTREHVKGLIARLRTVRDGLVALPDTDSTLLTAATAALDASLLRLQESVLALTAAEKAVQKNLKGVEEDVTRLTEYATRSPKENSDG